MQKIKKVLAIAIVIITLMFSACSKDNNEKPILPENSEGTESLLPPPETLLPPEPVVESKRITDFSSIINNEGILFVSWKDEDDINETVVNIDVDGNTTSIILDENENSFELTLDTNKKYNFDINFKSEQLVEYENLTFSRFYNPDLTDISFPRVEINTENGIIPSCSKISPPEGCIGATITNAEYVQSIVKLYNDKNEVIFESTTEPNDYEGSKIKIRGNTSAYQEKNSLKLKLDKKQDLLSELVEGRDDKNYKSKDWVLLSGGNNLNQVIGTTVSKTIGSDYTAEHSYVMLFLNGDYRGLYILSESVEQGNGEGDEQSRVAIDDDGFIIEQDAYWWNEDLWFSTPLTQNDPSHFTFKYPDSDDIDEKSEEYNYIKSYMIFVESLIINNNKSVKNYIDFDSFAKWILIHDYLGTWDTYGSNIYLTKKDSANSLLCMGPTWDYDSIMMIKEFNDIRYHVTHFYYYYLFNNIEFTEIYNQLFLQTKNNVKNAVVNEINKMDVTDYNALVEIENKRWKTENKTIEENLADIETWFDEKIKWLSDNI